MAATTQAPAAPPGNAPPAWNLISVVRRSLLEPANRPAWLGIAVCALLFKLLFNEVLDDFYYSWTTDENYSHGFLVPFIALYFADQAARRGPVEVKGGVWLGGIMLGLGILMRLVRVALPIAFLGEMAFLLGLAGIFGIFFGTAALRRYWFPLSFLVFMVPLPVAVYTRLASPLQLLASHVASTVMNATGVPVLREGNHMTLPGGLQLFVAEACSGMRQLTGFLALTTAVAYLSSRPAWYRIVIIGLGVPIALTANIARVLLTGYIMHFGGAEYALGTFHTAEGLLMMGFGLILLQLACWALDAVVAGSTSETPEDDASRQTRTGSNAPRLALSGTSSSIRQGLAVGGEWEGHR